MAWAAQGPIAERDLEKLAVSDQGVILYRRLLKEQMEKVAEGVDPMNVFRDPAENQCVTLPIEPSFYNRGPGKYTSGLLQAGTSRYSPIVDMVDGVMARRRASGRHSAAMGA